jgi:hypothetical protein
MAGRDLRRWQRAVLLTAGVVALILGVLGGLWRLDWGLPLPGTQPATFHGALIAAAFFGTLVGLEHAAAYGRRLAYLGPGCAALGGLLTAFGAPHPAAASLLLAGSILLAVMAFGNWRRDSAPHTVMALGGAFCAVVGSALWLAGLPASQAAGAWLAFLVLTVAGERLELSHLRRPSGTALAMLGAAAMLLVGGALAMPWQWRIGTWAAGAGSVGLALWLLVKDVARLNLRHHRQARFTSVCLVGGYGWLAAGGLLLPFAATEGPLHDAALHAVFLGFVFAAAMGHAADILPGLLDVELPYSPLFYVHIGLLDATLLLRVGGDVLGQPAWRAWGGLGNAVALALFLLITGDCIRRGGLREAGD